MSKLIRLAKGIDTEYRADPDFGEPKTERHATPDGKFFEETIYVLKPGVEVEVDDVRAEYLQRTWGWRLEIRDKPKP